MFTAYKDRLALLRKELAKQSMGGFVIPTTDEHQGEYIGNYAHRLRWLTGFQGSAAWGVVLPTRAAIFVDGRYAAQVREQIDTDLWECESSLLAGVVKWLEKYATPESRIGFDPWLHTSRWLAETERSLAAQSIRLVPVKSNPIDSVWHDQPARSLAKIRAHSDELAGQSAATKLQNLSEMLSKHRDDVVIITALDSIAWTFNIRGSDIPYYPVSLAFASVWADGSADLFVDEEKITAEVEVHLGDRVRLHRRAEFLPFLESLHNTRVAIDPDRAPFAVADALAKCGAQLIPRPDFVLYSKAKKNAVELEGMREAHIRDGAALTSFLHWISTSVANETCTEMAAAAKLRAFREATGAMMDLSFETISASGPHAANPHYRPTTLTDRPIGNDEIYLVDSGAHYLDGTTDVTRTVIVGKPSHEMMDRFTRVLKGHIALANTIFPHGTRGSQLDAIARRALWDVGLDYPHGTGHGVGTYLSVHEGPQRISSTASEDASLELGMIVSNEPGYYKAGEYGIRIENLLAVIPREIPGSEHAMLGFATMTLAPIDMALIDVTMLSPEERDWLNQYHRLVYEKLAPHVTNQVREWLARSVRPVQ